MKNKIFRILIYIPILLFVFFYMIPIYVLLVTGFKSFQEVNLATMWNLPSSIRFDNFIAAFKKLAPNLKNSFYMVIVGTILSSFLGSLNGYILSKWKFRGANLIFTMILFGMFIPYQSILIPLVKFMQNIKLYDKIPGLILVHIIYGTPITTLIFRNYYEVVPTEIIEAAHIDGAGFFSIYWRVILPLSIPSFVVVMIWQFTSLWNEFLFAVTLTGPQHWPVTVALQNLAGSQIVEWNVQMAGALIVALPTLLVYIFLGRFFLRGLMAGALKG